MKKHVLIAGLLIAAFSRPAFGQIIFQEDFNGIGGPTAGGAGTYSFPSGWLLRNVDNRTPAANVSYVNEAWERREDFANNVADSAAFSTSWYVPAGTSDDWMWTPAMTLTAQNVLTWRALAYDAAYPDGYEVRIMAAPNTPTGGTGVIGNQVTASTVLFSTAAEANAWTPHSVSLSAYAGQTVRIAFRNNANDKFLLLIDDVVVQQQINTDAQMLFADTVTEYTVTPLAQAAPLNFQGTIRNNGGNALSNVNAHVDVLLNGIAVHSDNSAVTASLASGASVNWTIPGYAPDAIGDYTVRFIAQQSTGADEQTANDTLYQSFTVSDTVYARDNGDVTGSLGIGAGNGGFLGQTFLVNADDTLTSVTVSFTQGYAGTKAAVAIWSMLNGEPDQMIATTDTILYATNDPLDTTIRIHGGPKRLTAGAYAVTAIEFDSTLALAQTSALFTARTTWVNWPTTPLGGWGNNEDFGAGFSKSYALRANFGDVCGGYALSSTSTDATCPTCADGSVAAIVAASHGDVDYTWDPDLGSGAIITDVLHGIYTVTAVDALGCSAMSVVAVAFDTCGFIGSVVNTLPASCALCADGTAWVDVSGDNGGLTFLWSNEAETDSITDLAIGTYTVMITDMYGCMLSDSGAVSFPTGLTTIGDLQGASLYPNPNPGTFQVSLGDVAGDVDAQLFDVRGVLLWSQRWPAAGDRIFSIDHAFAAGAYTLQLTSSKGRNTLPVVITAR